MHQDPLLVEAFHHNSEKTRVINENMLYKITCYQRCACYKEQRRHIRVLQPTSDECLRARSMYLRYGYVITSRRILRHVITYPCPRYLLFALNQPPISSGNLRPTTAHQPCDHEIQTTWPSWPVSQRKKIIPHVRHCPVFSEMFKWLRGFILLLQEKIKYKSTPGELLQGRNG